MARERDEVLRAFRTLGRHLEETLGIPKEDLLRDTRQAIPAHIFRSELSPFSALVSHLSSSMELREITRILKRNKAFVQASIKKAELDTTGTPLPVEIFSGELSVLEATAHYLKGIGMTNKEIADEIGKASSAVWILLKRAAEKLGGKA